MGVFRFSYRSQKRMFGVHPRLAAIAERALEISVVDFGIPEHGGLRTAEEQGVLFLQDVSNADGVNNLSKHQSGKALDFYAYVDGRASWEIAHLALVAAAFLQAASEFGVKLKWGGFWGRGPYYPRGFTDMPHVELG